MGTGSSGRRSISGRDVSLTEHLSAFVTEQVRRKRHRNASEVVHEAMRRYEDALAVEHECLETIRPAVGERREAIADTSRPATEAGRLAALGRYAILDTPPEDGFDGLASLAAQICGAPVGLVTFVDGARQFFKARIGFDGAATAPLDVGFCPLVVRNAGALVIPDARADPAYGGNAAVTHGGVRFYAGVPLVTPDGHVLGTLCVIDHAARPEGLSGPQLRAIEMLAAQTTAQLELRRAEALARREGEHAARQGRRLALLAGASARLLTAENPAAIVRDTYALLAGLFRLDVCLHYRCEAGGLGLVAAAGLNAEQEAKAARIEFGQMVSGVVAATRQAVQLAGILASNDPRTAFLKALGIDIYAATPLMAGDEFLGTFSFGRRSGPFSVGELDVLLTLVSYIALALIRLRAESERRATEEALRDSQARLQAIFDAVPVGIIIAEAPSGRIVAANRQVEAIFRHRVIHSPDVERYRDWVSHHPDGRQVEGREYPLARALAGEERPEMEALYQRGDGTQAWMRFIAAPTRSGPDGRITGAVVASLDIDKEARALRALARAREELEARVRHEVGARETAQAQLAQAEKMTALGQLAGGIAHDFNNTLQAVSGGASLIKRSAGNPATVERLARIVEEAARRGASVTRRLLAFARRGELRAEPVDVPTLLDGLCEVLAHTLGADVAVRMDVAPGLPPMLADRGQLETALVNLATNARDAMPGGGTLTLSASAEAVEGEENPDGLVPGTYIRLTAADEGTGMDAATLARVTEPFFTTKPSGKGTGLGLAMARGFAEQSGGALTIASEPGRGTTVALWLPAASAGAAAGVAARPEEFGAVAASAGAPRVLLVDDEQLVREVLAAQLADHGYDVVQADGGGSALELLDMGEVVSLLVSDLSMPGMDGVALIRAAQSRRPHLPAILLTGYAGEAASLAVGKAVSGSFSLLRKPVGGAQLADRVATLLEATLAPPRASAR